MIKDSPFAFLKNASISFFNRATNSTNANVTTTLYKVGYISTNSKRLAIPYALVLGIFLILTAIGFAAML